MRYDAAIVGGGLVGACLALILSDSGLKVALIESTPSKEKNPRLFGLTASSCEFLQKISIWEKLAEYAEPIREVHVSYQGQFGAVRLRNTDVNLPQLGFVVPACEIEKVLIEALSHRANIHYYCPATLINLHQNDEVTLTLTTDKDEKILNAALVFAADGANSTVRKLIKIETEEIDYQQSAIVTQTLLQRSHRQTAYERFTTNGAIAMLPLKDNCCATIWTADQQTIDELMSLSDELFVSRLQQNFGYRLGKFKSILKRFKFPLVMTKAKQNYLGNIFLLGNAAHALHPIAAQGFNLALCEVMAVADMVCKKTQQNKLFSSKDFIKIIQDTESQRSFSVLTSHGLASMPKQQWLLNMFLPLGMVGLDMIMPLKRMFINKMIGKKQRIF